MQAFAEEVRRRFKLPVHLWDERLTSVQANRLLRETEMSIKRRGAVVDQMAAVPICSPGGIRKLAVFSRWSLVVRKHRPRISRIKIEFVVFLIRVELVSSAFYDFNNDQR